MSTPTLTKIPVPQLKHQSPLRIATDVLDETVTENCKLCQTPLGTQTPSEGGAHAACFKFSCPSCISAKKPTYALMNFSNAIFDYSCSECVEEAVGAMKMRKRLSRNVTSPAILQTTGTALQTPIPML